MAECVHHSHLHRLHPGILHAGDIGNRRDVVVIEAMAKSEDCGGEQRELKIEGNAWHRFKKKVSGCPQILRNHSRAEKAATTKRTIISRLKPCPIHADC